MTRPVKASNNQSKPRGRPRSELRKQAILSAARALLEEAGPFAVTMEAIAARAGVGKPTVYRWFSNREAVLMSALMVPEEARETAQEQTSALTALRDKLRQIAARFGNNTGRHVASLIAASDAQSELSKAFRNHFVLARRAEGRALLTQAIESGEVRADMNVEVMLELLYGPLFFRLLLGHGALNEAFVDEVLAHALRGMAR
ncbi:MAG: TetR/AcrR family transcriptional regulator [Myxococcaceae bacterium]|nr:TetR/AcrR family transcriptional regulator [Myxococcaceae bacterium]